MGVGVREPGEGAARGRGESTSPGTKGTVPTPTPAVKKQELSGPRLQHLLRPPPWVGVTTYLTASETRAVV